MRILLVEDDRRSREFLARGLTEEGFAVDTAADGEDGLNQALERDYDLIILDVMLPRRDGWSVITELRKHSKAVPVLFLTARDTVPDRVKPNTRTAAMVQWTDFLPTCLAVAGGAVPEGLDGRSFLPVLRGETTTHHGRIFTTHSGDNNMNVFPMRAVRDGRWKYIRNLHPEFEYHTHIDLDNGRLAQCDFFASWQEAAKSDAAARSVVQRYHQRPAEELYDLEADPHEQRNLIGQPDQAERTVAMRQQLDEWMKAQGDQQKVYGIPRRTGEERKPGQR